MAYTIKGLTMSLAVQRTGVMQVAVSCQDRPDTWAVRGERRQFRFIPQLITLASNLESCMAENVIYNYNI